MSLPALLLNVRLASLRLALALALPLCLCAPLSVQAGGMGTASSAEASAPSNRASEPEQEGVETIEYDPNDPAIQAAVKAARKSLPEFFKVIATPSSTITNMAVKVEVSDGKVREYIWVMPFHVVGEGKGKGKAFEGQVNDIPRKVRKVVTGQQLRFTEADIVDWAYSDLHQHKMFGNYTTCVPLRKAPAEERQTLKRVYGLDCDKP
jgi:uncharacterized protein YegJ (DUF2314 family)